jgi:hypothetical protein
VEDASHHNFWIRVKQTSQKLEEHSTPPPTPPIEEDKLKSLKRIVLVVIHDLQIILTSIRQVLTSRTDTQVLGRRHFCTSSRSYSIGKSCQRIDTETGLFWVVK